MNQAENPASDSTTASNEKSVFEASEGLSWAERAKLGGLAPVIGPTSHPDKNMARHLIEMAALKKYVRPLRRVKTAVDFGCGIGRFFPWILKGAEELWGLEITPGMLDKAREEYLARPEVRLQLFDGRTLPEEIGSPQRIFCCGVLRDTYYADIETYRAIVRNWFERLEPGGEVIQLEMYVQDDPKKFSDEFVRAGFQLTRWAPIMRYKSKNIRRVAKRLRVPIVRTYYARREVAEAAKRKSDEPVDYLFVYSKT